MRKAVSYGYAQCYIRPRPVFWFLFAIVACKPLHLYDVPTVAGLPLHAHDEVLLPYPQLCIGPKQVREGDSIVIFETARMPFVLCKPDGKSTYRLLGPAYVRDRMRGQIFDPLE